MNNMTIITNHKGAFPSHAYDREPEPGSVVLTEGQFGTAWQRFFADGKWHSAGSEAPKTWQELLHYRNLTLVYNAETRA